MRVTVKYRDEKPGLKNLRVWGNPLFEKNLRLWCKNEKFL
jgi:hypothetical protein